ncbi:hypothetical protein JHV56_16585 [Arthrobacter sp. BHU FT2]|nr:hypothetical protein [Arthrobacter sp. BHU FT2]
MASDHTIQETVADFKETWKPIKEKNSNSWRAAFRDAGVTPSGIGKIAPSTAQVYSNGDQILVRAGLVGAGVVEPFGISIVFNKSNGTLTQTAETTFVQGDGGGTVTTWVDGNKVLERFVPDSSAEQISTVGWNEFTACLNGAGVAAWVVTAITIACSAICIGTAGAGCIPCITAAAGVTGGVFYSCAAQALFYS